MTQWRFNAELQQFGPEGARIGRLGLAEAQEYCAWVTRTHYENFSVVTKLLPAATRPALEAVYAFCRWSDDLGDETGDPAAAQALLSWWRDEIDRMEAGRPRHPVLLALAETIREYAIPLAPFRALVSAFEQDQVIREYETDEQLRDYCTRSANPVGELVLYVARAHTAENCADSDAVCTGLQLANFWQDVDRDLTLGRIYLPRADRITFGYADADLRARRFTPAFADLLAQKTAEARTLLHRGEPLADRLPPPWDVSIALFARGGLAILDRIVAQNYDVWSRRPRLGKAAKLRLFLGAWMQRRISPSALRRRRRRRRESAHS